VAVSFTGYLNLLHEERPGTWATLENATSPIATAIAMLAGSPILAEVQAPNVGGISPVVDKSPVRLTSIGAGTESFWLLVGTSAQLTIVSPDRREAAIVSTMEVGALERGGAIVRSGATLLVEVRDASSIRHDYRIQGVGPVRLPIELNRGLNRVLLSPVQTVGSTPSPAVPESDQLLDVPSLTLAGRY
jgi:hypothetical protein